jgi:hypothetical protein
MNKRIKELARESGLLHYNPDKQPNKLEMFAELIIKECVEVCYEVNREYEDEDVYASAIWCAHEIHKHFGVEE